ncbi:MAG: hypothetical protein RL141_862 [Candidatus Parcubacteria bacterium]
MVIALSVIIGGCSSEASRSITSPNDQTNAFEGVAIIAASGSETSPHQVDRPELAAGSQISLYLRADDESTLLAESAVTSGEITIPSFIAKSGPEGTTIDVYVDGVLYGSIDMHRLPELPNISSEIEEAVVDRGEKSFIVDANLATIARNTPQFYGEASQNDSQEPPNDSEMFGVATQALNLCGGGINGPGNVVWNNTSPGQNGQKFSVAPESNNTLIWAVFYDQNIDAIYRSQWGCGTAWKVPNPCTAIASIDGVLSYCCPLQWRVLGYVPSWINTYADPYFPDCPLP